MYNSIAAYIGGDESIIPEDSKPKMNRKRMIIRAVFVLLLIAIIVIHIMSMRSMYKNSSDLSMIMHRVSVLESATGQPTQSNMPAAVSTKSGFTPINYLNELNLFKSLPANEQHEYLNLSKEDKRAKYPNALQ